MKTNNSAKEIIRKIKGAIRAPYAWPGGYPISVIMSDGAAICPSCAKQNFRSIVWSTKNRVNDGWRPAGVEILWEGGHHCEQCSCNLDAYPSDATA